METSVVDSNLTALAKCVLKKRSEISENWIRARMADGCDCAQLFEANGMRND